jgi:hypothetical protein
MANCSTFSAGLPAGSAQRGLAHDLRRQLVVRHTGAGEERQFLAAQQGIHAVDGRDAGLDVIARINARGRVDRLPVDIGITVGQWLRAAVQRFAQTVEDTSEHFFGHRDVK